MVVMNKRKISVWTNKGFVLFSVFILIAVALCIIMLLLPRKKVEYQGKIDFESGMPEKDFVVYDNISLNPGVYIFQLEYETDSDLEAYCSVRDGSVISGALLNNYEHFYRDLGLTGFEAWLFEKTDSLQLCVNFSGKGNLSVGKLRVVETKLLWTMCLTIIAMLWGVGAFCIWFRENERLGVITQETKQVFFWLGVFTVIASLPNMFGYNISGADFTYHLQRIEGVKDGLLSGQIPVRLEPKWLYDHGYADAIFYCNIFLIVPAFFRIMGFPISFSYNVYGIAVNLATVLISYFSFKGIFKDEKIGITCSGLYSLSIFRIYKFVITSAVGEGTAYTFLPLVILGFYRIFAVEQEKDEHKNGWVPLCMGLAGIIQSHVLTCEISAMVILAMCILNIKRIFRRDIFAGLFKAAAISLLLGAWFLVPFIDYYLTQDLHVKHVSARTIQESGLEISHLLFHFWKTGDNTPVTGSGVFNSHPVGIGLVLMIPCFLFLALWFLGKLNQKGDLRLEFVKKLLIIGVVLLGMSTNLFPWDRIQRVHSLCASLISSIQFPNRFLGWGTACMVTVFGYCMLFYRDEYWKSLGLILLAFFGLVTSSLRLIEYASVSGNHYELYNSASMGFGYISGAEYLIEGTDEERLSFSKPRPSENVNLLGYEKKMLGAIIRCENLGNAEGVIELPLLLYKGYHAKNLDTHEEMEIKDGDNHLVSVQIPSGFHGNIEISFASPVYWRMAEMISLMTGICLAWSMRRKFHENGK